MTQEQMAMSIEESILSLEQVKKLLSEMISQALNVGESEAASAKKPEIIRAEAHKCLAQAQECRRATQDKLDQAGSEVM